MVATTTFMLARMLLVAATIRAMRKAGLLKTVLKGRTQGQDRQERKMVRTTTLLALP
jgi:hypothetical protein